MSLSSENILLITDVMTMYYNTHYNIQLHDDDDEDDVQKKKKYPWSIWWMNESIDWLIDLINQKKNNIGVKSCLLYMDLIFFVCCVLSIKIKQSLWVIFTCHLFEFFFLSYIHWPFCWHWNITVGLMYWIRGFFNNNNKIHDDGLWPKRREKKEEKKKFSHI